MESLFLYCFNYSIASHCWCNYWYCPWPYIAYVKFSLSIELMKYIILAGQTTIATTASATSTGGADYFI